MPEFPALPVTEALPDLTAALRAGPGAVLVAPPGAGKTTLVPLALLAEPWAAGGRILVLEPRRVAARAAARRMAALLGEAAPGGTVGLSTRLDRAVSPGMRVEVVTEGLLVRRLQSDPGLDGVAAVLFDEAHERNLDTDLALALCLDLQRGLRPELRLLAMSATLDGAAFAGLMGGVPVIESLGRAFPVAVEYRPRDLRDVRDLPEAMAAAIRGALRDYPGDVLAFLPGWSAIRRTTERLGGLEAEVLPLHGGLSPAEQDRALNPSERRKVVLATAIAETSLTVPGVRIVVDGGYRRAPRLDPASGLSRLATLRISRAGGRAARRPRRPHRAGGGDPAVDRGHPPRPPAPGPPGDPGGGAVRPRPRPRGLGRRAGLARLPGPAARRRPGRRPGATARPRRAGRGGARHAHRPPHGRARHPSPPGSRATRRRRPRGGGAGRRPRRPAGGARPRPRP